MTKEERRLVKEALDHLVRIQEKCVLEGLVGGHAMRWLDASVTNLRIILEGRSAEARSPERKLKGDVGMDDFTSMSNFRKSGMLGLEGMLRC